MRVLFVHKNFPAQYLHLAPAMAAQGHEVVALAINKHPELLGIQVAYYVPPPPQNFSAGPRIHSWLTDFETRVICGEAAAEAAFELKKRGFTPDLICAHAGFGEALFLKDVWPESKLLSIFEFYYKPYDGFMTFDPEFTPKNAPKLPMLIRMRNANTLLNFEVADHGITATHFQKSVFPSEFQSNISVCHEGIDTNVIKPDSEANCTLPDGTRIRRSDEIITFVSRDLEPLRGYHSFMRALPGILRARPRARVLIVGGSGVGYGWHPPQGRSWKQIFFEEVKESIDVGRVHFLGIQPRDTLTKILQISSVHVYLTYPHVLSWSCLEAMSCEALLIGSATLPVMEVIEHQKNGLLVDFFSKEELTEAVCRVFEHPNRMRELREAGRRTAIQKFDLHSICLPRQLEIANSVVSGHAVM